jgi:hypothetical protein
MHPMPGPRTSRLAANATIRIRPRWAFGIAHDDFTGSPTRWVFD